MLATQEFVANGGGRPPDRRLRSAASARRGRCGLWRSAAGVSSTTRRTSAIPGQCSNLASAARRLVFVLWGSATERPAGHLLPAAGCVERTGRDYRRSRPRCRPDCRNRGDALAPVPASVTTASPECDRELSGRAASEAVARVAHSRWKRRRFTPETVMAAVAAALRRIRQFREHVQVGSIVLRVRESGCVRIPPAWSLAGCGGGFRQRRRYWWRCLAIPGSPTRPARHEAAEDERDRRETARAR